MDTQRPITVNDQQLSRAGRERLLSGLLKIHREHIEDRLRVLGADRYDLLLPETHALPLIIRSDEVITGIVYGRYKQSDSSIGRGTLVATDSRLLLVDRKILSLKCDEIAYTAVTAITYNKVGPAATITLHSRIGDISVRTFNWRCAQNFIADLENTIFKVRQLQQPVAF
jgi:hypothetical protein